MVQGTAKDKVVGMGRGIIYNQNFKYLPEPIINNRKLYTMKPQGSSINKPGSKYSPATVIYNRSLYKMGATDLCERVSTYNGMLDNAMHTSNIV